MRLVALLLVLAGCSSSAPAPPAAPSEPAQLGSPWAPDRPGACADRRWGGWDGTPECAATAERLIAGADRTCSTDADCVKLSASNCDDNVLSTTAAPRYRDWPRPCNDLHAGDCSPSHAVCSSGGCCRNVDR